MLFSSYWQIHNQCVRKWTDEQQNQNTDYNAFQYKFKIVFYLAIEEKIDVHTIFFLVTQSKTMEK